MESEWDSFEVYDDVDYDEYLRSPAWRSKRAYLIAKVGNRCQLCNAAGPFEIHHRTYDRLGAEDEGDLLVLCSACHGRFHGELGAAALAGAPMRDKRDLWDYPRWILVVVLSVGLQALYIAGLGYGLFTIFWSIVSFYRGDNFAGVFQLLIGLVVGGFGLGAIVFCLKEGKKDKDAWHGFPRTPGSLARRNRRLLGGEDTDYWSDDYGARDR